MSRAILLRRTLCCFNFGLIQSILKRTITNLNAAATEKKKKKLSELTPQEIEIDLRENLVSLKKCIEKDESKNNVVPIFKKTLLHIDNIAVKDLSGEYTYFRLFLSAKRLAIQISNLCGSAAMNNVAYLCPNNILSPLAQWSCWMSGQVAMPMNMCYSAEMLRALLEDAKSSLLIVSPEYEKLGKDLTLKLDIPLLVIDTSFVISENTTLSSVPRLLIASQGSVMVEGTFTNDFYERANAMLVYTPGTTGKPKGVMLSHKNLNAQVKSLIQAWKLNSNDCFMHALPLNNALGAISFFMSAMCVGGRIIMQNDSSSQSVWSTLLGINTPAKERVNVFMAVPSIYNSLLVDYERTLAKNIKMVEYISNYFKENVRLMASYSAPLPPTIFRRWHEVTGHNIIESYGSTECGLIMSNSYQETSKVDVDKMKAGFVGLPMPDVRARLVSHKGEVLIDCLGEYNNDVWSINYLNAKESERLKIKENVTEKLNTENSAARLAAAAAKSNIDTGYTIGNLTDAFLRQASKLIQTLLHPNGFIQRTFHQLLSKDKATEDSSISKNENVSTPPLEQEIERPKPIVNSDPKPPTPKVLIGELQISGPQVFNVYYNNKDSTNLAFTDAFYKSGDMASFENGVFKILGRLNEDIVEIAGKQISSYDIESLLLEHPSIRDVTVVTISDEKFKAQEDSSPTSKPIKSLGVICVLNQNTKLDLESLSLFCSKSLPKYLLPKKLKIVDELPRSNMAIIDKRALKKLLEEVDESRAEKIAGT